MTKTQLNGLLAREWRERHGLTRAQLAEMIGYAPMTIYWAERGETPPGRGGDGNSHPIQSRVWLRYQRACQGLDELTTVNSQIKRMGPLKLAFRKSLASSTSKTPSAM